MANTIHEPSTENRSAVDLVQEVNKRWSETKGGNADEVLGAFADKVQMLSTLSPDIPHEVSGTHFTKAQAAQYFESVARDWEMIDFVTDRYITDEDDIVMVGRCHWRHRETGRDVDSPYVQIMHFEDGKVTQFIELFDSLGFARAIGAEWPADVRLAPPPRFGLTGRRAPGGSDTEPVPPSNPDLVRLAQGYANWCATRGGNIDEVLDLMADTIEMRSVLTPDVPIPVSGDRNGKALAREYFEGVTKDWEVVDCEVERFIAQDNDIVMVGYWTWKNLATGQVVESPKVDIWHFEGGKATSYLEMYDSLGVARAAGAA